MPRKCLNILLGLRAFVCYDLRERAVFFSLFLGNWHSVRAGIAGCPPDAVHATHLYVPVSWQPYRLRKNALSKTIAISVLIFLAATANAQTPDTTVVDTTSFSTYDPETQSSGEDNYADTTERHIYDTSQYFFTWKKDSSDRFAYTKIKQRPLPDSTVQQLKNSKDFWYIPAIEKLEKRIKDDPAFRDSLLKAANKEITNEEGTFTQQPWFKKLLWFIIISIFIAAIIYFLVQNKINLFAKQSLARTTETFGDNENGDIFQLQYSELLRRAEHEGNYRSAVRLLYLQTVKLLAETGHIQYQQDYTNLQFVQQLSKSSLYANFFTVTRHYEFVWYGKIEISKALYEKVKNDFLTLHNKVAA